MSSEFRRIATLAWPSSLAMLTMMGMNVIDSICVGQLGPEPQAGVSIAIAWAYSAAILPLGMTRALDPLVSQAHGEGNVEAAGQALVRMLVLTLPMAALSMGWFWATEAGLLALGQEPGVAAAAGAYGGALAWSLLPMFALSALRQFLSALGIVRTPLAVMVAGTLAKGPLNLILMSGAGPIPAFGVAGLGYATAIIDLALVFALVWEVRATLRVYWPKHPALDLPSLLSLARLGFSTGVQMGTEFWAFATMAVMMGWLGKVPSSAHATAMNLASVSFMIPLGISTAASARVGHLVGAGLDWRPAVRAGLTLGVVGQLISAAVFLVFADWLVRPYSPDPAVRMLAASLLPIAAAFQVFDGLQVVGFGLLRGAGDVRVPTLANLVGYYVLGIPLAYYFGIYQGGGPAGIWWGLTLGLSAVAAALLVRIRMVMGRGAVRLRV